MAKTMPPKAVVDTLKNLLSGLGLTDKGGFQDRLTFIADQVLDRYSETPRDPITRAVHRAVAGDFPPLNEVKTHLERLVPFMGMLGYSEPIEAAIYIYNDGWRDQSGEIHTGAMIVALGMMDKNDQRAWVNNTVYGIISQKEADDEYLITEQLTRAVVCTHPDSLYPFTTYIHMAHFLTTNTKLLEWAKSLLKHNEKALDVLGDYLIQSWDDLEDLTSEGGLESVYTVIRLVLDHEVRVENYREGTSYFKAEEV